MYGSDISFAFNEASRQRITPKAEHVQMFCLVKACGIHHWHLLVAPWHPALPRLQLVAALPPTKLKELC